jgi:ribonuclease BN (tRNA processing enzyme)
MKLKPVILAAVVAAAVTGAPLQAQETPDFTVTLLGTGVPNPTTARFGPSTRVQVADQTLVFDAGRGAMQRIKQFEIVPASIDHIFLTHFHSDHTIGLPDLLIHEVAMAADAIKNNPPIQIIMAHHTDPSEAAEVFGQAKPKMAAFTHFVFLGTGPGRPAAGDVMAEASQGYDGPMIDGVDLMQFVIGDTVEVVDPRKGI